LDNAAERCIQPITLNRKNALFFGSVNRSAGAALMFSLVENCKLHEVNVLDWLKDVLLRIATQSKDKLIELLPHNWKPPQRKPII
jgi:hypothetical protein